MFAVFRTDASASLGIGHLTRCLALARALRDSGNRVVFCCRPLAEALADWIQAEGHTYQALAEANDERQDAENLWRVAACERPNWIVLDHYQLHGDWELQLQKQGVKVLAIDDNPTRPHVADLLLDQSAQEDRFYRQLAAQSRLLLGPRFALLRPQFAAARRRARTPAGTIRKVLVSFGGSDPSNQTLKALRALAPLDLTAIEVVVGAINPHLPQIRKEVERLEHASLHVQVSELASLMLTVDLCLGSPGSTSWERCCLGLPALVVIQAENQQFIASLGEQLGFHRNLGWDRTVSPDQIASALLELQRQPDQLQEMSARGRDLVDGLGAQRVAQIMVEMAD